jgi:hypothetical protein
MVRKSLGPGEFADCQYPLTLRSDYDYALQHEESVTEDLPMDLKLGIVLQ